MTKSVEVRGLPKNGQPWKETRTQRTSASEQSRKRLSFDERMLKKKKIDEVRQMESEMKAAASEIRQKRAEKIRERRRKAAEKEMQATIQQKKKKSDKSLGRAGLKPIRK